MSPGPALTRRQQAIFDYLVEREERGESPPSLDELCEAMGLKSRGSMHAQIKALLDEGLVEPMGGRHRGVRVRREAAPAPEQLPLLGAIAAGQPIEAIENPDWIDVPSQLRSGGECFVLQVRGDSMVEAGILDGDWVVIEKRTQANDGEIVVALTDGENATLKRLRRMPDKVLLIPENSEMTPIEMEPGRVQIQGVLVGQMRAYR